MKAHIARTPKLVLAWGFEPGSAALARLEAAAKTLRMTVKPVGEPDLNRCVAELCGLPCGNVTAEFEATDTAFPAAAVFCGLTDKELDRMLAELRGADIPLKAIVTPTSRDWALGALLAKLCKERDALAAGNAAGHSES